MDALGYIPFGEPVVSVSAGAYHTCVILGSSSGTLKCFGYSNHGRLGYSTPGGNQGDAPGEIEALPAIAMGAGRSAVAVSAGLEHTCYVDDLGDVRCFGRGADGRTGTGSTEDVGANHNQMANLPAIGLGEDTGTAVDVCAGAGHSCALFALPNGRIKCWGRGNEGQLALGFYANIGDGPGETGNLDPIPFNRPATAIACGAYHVLALFDDGSVRAWGDSRHGKTGYDTESDIGNNGIDEIINLPAINLGQPAVAISAGQDFSCSVLSDGGAKCFGRNNVGQLAQDRTSSIGYRAGDMAGLQPIYSGGRLAVATASGEGHACLAFSDGTLRCHGEDNHGRLGTGLGGDNNVGDASGNMAAALDARLGGDEVSRCAAPAPAGSGASTPVQLEGNYACECTIAPSLPPPLLPPPSAPPFATVAARATERGHPRPRHPRDRRGRRGRANVGGIGSGLGDRRLLGRGQHCE